jgi:hypothetical protein
LPLPTAWSHSAESSSIHEIFLLIHFVHAPATAATAATGHGECIAFETAAEPGLNDLAQVAGHERDHLDAVSRNDRLQRPGNRAANERADAKLRQAKRLPNWHVIG